jgi:hypothetical protein
VLEEEKVKIDKRRKQEGDKYPAPSSLTKAKRCQKSEKQTSLIEKSKKVPGFLPGSYWKARSAIKHREMLLARSPISNYMQESRGFGILGKKC